MIETIITILGAVLGIGVGGGGSYLSIRFGGIIHIKIGGTLASLVLGAVIQLVTFKIITL